jgi:hypothetical protein
VLAFPHHGDFFEHGKIDAKGAAAKAGNLFVGAGFLALEVIGGETGNDEPAITIGAIQLFQRLILLGEPALGRDIDNKKDFAGVLAQVSVFAVDAAYGNVLDGCAHIQRL